MSLAKYITTQLYQLMKDPTDAAGDLEQHNGQITWRVRHEGDELTLTMAHPDRHSAELHALTVVAAQPAAEHPALPALAERLCERLACLEEPLATWELDTSEQTAQLRSQPPLRDGDSIYYWEVTLATTAQGDHVQTSATISRHHWQPGMAERATLPCPATFAMLGRLAHSLTLR